MGGGTGTGAAPIVATVARDLGCLTVAIVTEPFRFEGRQRCRQAAAGLEELRRCADTVLVVANDRLTQIVPGQMSMANAFLVADDVLRQGVRCCPCGLRPVVVAARSSDSGLVGLGNARR